MISSQSAETHDRRAPGPTVPLAAIVTAAAVLRLWGLGYGLPAVYNPDEVAIMNRTLAFGTGDLNPHNFVYPTLYFYVLFAWEGLFFLAGRAAGAFESVAAFERTFFVDPTSIYLAGRAFSALCGVLTVVATYRLARRAFGTSASLAAAALLAVAPLAVRDAHYVKHDVPVTLLVVVCHLLLADVLFDASRRQRLWRWALLGGMAGLAASTHYYAVFLTLPIGVAALALRDEPAQPSSGSEPGTVRLSVRAWRLLVAAVACLASFAVTSPFLLIDRSRAWADIVANRQIVMDRATEASGLFASLDYYGRWLTLDAVGPIAAVLALAGLVVIISRGWRSACLFAMFPITFLLFIANTFPASRYLNPLLPFVAVWAGAVLAWLLTRTQLVRGLAIAAAVLAVADAGRRSVAIDRFVSRDDTRTLAQRWIESSVLPGTAILVQPYSVPLRMSHAALEEALTHHLGSHARASVKFQRQLALSPYPSPAYRTIYLGSGGLDVDRLYLAPAAFDQANTLGPLRNLSVEYVVLKQYNDADPSLAAFEAALAREARLIATFSPYSARSGTRGAGVAPPFLHNTDARIDDALERPGPTIEVWRIN